MKRLHSLKRDLTSLMNKAGDQQGKQHLQSKQKGGAYFLSQNGFESNFKKVLKLPGYKVSKELSKVITMMTNIHLMWIFKNLYHLESQLVEAVGCINSTFISISSYSTKFNSPFTVKWQNILVCPRQVHLYFLPV